MPIKNCYFLLSLLPEMKFRFWHSTAAYGIANESSMWDLPPADHRIYFWPQDLLQPTAVIYLKVSENVRHQRMQSRHEKVLTFEEDRLKKVALFRQRYALVRSYYISDLPVYFCYLKLQKIFVAFLTVGKYYGQ